MQEYISDIILIILMISLDFCPVCNSSSIGQYQSAGTAPHIKHEIMPKGFVRAAVLSRYSECHNCNLIFQNPRLSDSELKKYSSLGYYRQQLNLTEKQIDDDEEQRAKVDAQIIKKNIGEVSSHLDVGGSRGYFLDAIGAKNKVIVEPNIKYPKVRGLKVYPELNKVPAQKFDLVTMVHVLEHVPKPLEYLKYITSFVDKDGYLVIEVPTWESPGGPLRLAHLYYFEPDVLKLMCKQIGLSVEYTEFTPHLVLICKKKDLRFN